ncbi:MAG: hypothetical protein ACTSWL_05310, partial [Promethearchaeota archaeon]
YLWKGNQAKVRSKFIGARKLQDIRSQVGLNYRSVSLDEDEIEDGEFPEFFSAIESARVDGFAHEIREDGGEVAYEIGNTVSTKVSNGFPKSSSANYNKHIQQSGPLYTGDPSQNSALPSMMGTNSAGAVDQGYSQLQLEQIIEAMDKDGIPDGYSRELIVIGDKTYTVTEKVQKFFNQTNVERKLDLIDTLPEGVFFAEEYVPRVLVQNRVVIAIEFLKRNE